MKAHAFVFGFGGSQAGHFRALLAWYEEQGCAATLLIPRVRSGFTSPGVLRADPERLAQHASTLEGCCIVHAFSNNGFMAAARFVCAFQREATLGSRVGRIGGFVFDSCPGFPDGNAAEATATFFARGLGPMVSGRLGLGTERGELFVSPLQSLLVPYFRVRQSLAANILATPGEFLKSRPPVQQLYFASGRDPVVPEREIRAFVGGERDRGVPVKVVHFPELGHVAGWFRERDVYAAALKTQLEQARRSDGA